MKTALKLNKKQLFDLYEKSSEQVKKGLRAEFGEVFFVAEKSDTDQGMADCKPVKQNKSKMPMNWETIFDFTSILRMMAYACLIWMIFF